MEIGRVYTESIKRDLEYFATWPIGAKYKLGDYGELVNGKFKRRGNISDEYDINIKVLSNSDKNEIKFRTGIAIETNIEAETQGKINLRFNKNKGVYFHLQGCSSQSIRNYQEIGNEILKIYGKVKSKWRESYVVITEIIKAESSIIIVSNEKNGEIELSTEFDSPTKAFDIKPSMNLKVCKSKGTAVEITGEKNLTPLIKLSKIESNEFSEHDLNEYKGIVRNRINKVILYLIRPLCNRRGGIGYINTNYNIAAAITKIDVQTNEMKLFDNKYMNKFIDINNINNTIIPKYFVLEDGNTIVLRKQSKRKMIESINRNVSNGYKINTNIYKNKKVIKKGYKINIFKEI